MASASAAIYERGRQALSGAPGGQSWTYANSNEPSGRRLTSALPDDPVEVGRCLVHALVPFTASYPCPHVRNG